MPLQIWLPLTNGIENYGLMDLNLTNGGATVDNAGKIGKCYHFNVDDSSYVGTTGVDCDNITEWTIAAWVYPELTSSSNHWVVGINGTQATNFKFAITYISSKFGVRLAGTSYTATTTCAINSWYHVCSTYSNNTLKIYINGELVLTNTSTVEPSTTHNFNIGKRQGDAEYFTGKVNDVRLYDEVLSVKQIKLLAQGLVAHYQLNTEWGLANIARTEVSYYYPTQYQAYRINLSENLVKGDTYTLQFWDVDISHTGKTESQLGIWVYWGGGSVSLFNWHGTSYFTNGHADYLSYTFVAPNSSSSSTDNPYLNLYNTTPNAEGTKYMHIGRWKLEKGSVATPWQPNSLDAEYATMGWGDNIIYDSSGYNNHMQKVGDIIATTNTSRNTVSTHFTNGQYGISFYNSNSGYLPTDALTVNLWMYCTTWGNPISCTEGGGFNFENISGLQFPLYVSGIGYKTPNSGVAVSTLLNAWHMLTGTFDRTTVKIYIDGELKATTATGSTNGVGYSAARLCLAAEAKNTVPQSSTFVGSLSDVRIYATALSDEDIMALYNAPVSVTNLGTMVTQGEFVEK